MPDKTRTVIAVRAPEPTSPRLSWPDGRAADLYPSAMLDDRAVTRLRDPAEFAKLVVGDPP